MKRGILKRILALVLIMVVCGVSLAAQSTGGGSSRAPANFVLKIVTNPGNAQIFIDGKPVKGTDFTLPAGNHTIVVKAQGFQDFSTTVNLAQNMTITANLQPLGYRLSVQSNVQGADVFINNKPVGKTNFTGTFPPGNYQVRVVMPGFSDFNTTVALKSDTTVNAALKPMMFSLTVQSSIQGAQVFINKNRAGATNFTGQYPPGTYAVQVSMPGFQDFITTINLNQNMVIDANLIPLMAKVQFTVPQNIQDTRIPGSINQIKIYIDGKPANLGLNDIPPGSHVIRITSGGLADEQTVNFQAGQTYNIVLNFGFIVQ